MSELQFIKAGNGLAPLTDEAKHWLDKVAFGTIIWVVVKVMRNGRFFGKWWVLMKYAYENWDAPDVVTKFGTSKKSFNRFRKDIILRAGFYEIVTRIDGTVIFEPASIAWAKMTEAEFAELYSKSIDVILTHVLHTHTEEDIDRAMNNLANFM